VYDEVDEDVYRSVVRGRLMEDDFIEEDNGVSGYADHGMDEWDRSGSEKDEDEDMDGADASTLFLPARRFTTRWL
jgi:DNA polymerase alpha subunit A